MKDWLRKRRIRNWQNRIIKLEEEIKFKQWLIIQCKKELAKFNL